MDVGELLAKKERYRVKRSSEIYDLLHAIVRYANSEGLSGKIDLNWIDFSGLNPKDNIYLVLPEPGSMHALPGRNADYYFDISGWNLENFRTIDGFGEFLKRFVDPADYDDLLDKFKFTHLESSDGLFKGISVTRPHRLEFPSAKSLRNLFQEATVGAPVAIVAPKLVDAQSLMMNATASAPVFFEKAPYLNDVSFAYKLKKAESNYKLDVAYLAKFVATPEKQKTLSKVIDLIEQVRDTIVPKLEAAGITLGLHGPNPTGFRFHSNGRGAVLYTGASFEEVSEYTNGSITESDWNLLKELASHADTLGYFPTTEEDPFEINEEAKKDPIRYFMNQFKALDIGIKEKPLTTKDILKIEFDLLQMADGKDPVFTEPADYGFKRYKKRIAELPNLALDTTRAIKNNPDTAIDYVKKILCI